MAIRLMYQQLEKFVRAGIQRSVTGSIAPATAIAALLVVPAQAAIAHVVTHSIPLVPPASHPLQQGFVRIVNRSNGDGTVTIHALDDTGGRFGPISFELRENTAVHFNSTDMEQGNTAKGLLGSTGSGNGNWRLELESDLDIEALAYIRTGSGFLTSMHDLVAEVAPGIYRVPIFNPGSNLGQQSRLRLTNAGSSDAEITITGRDDQGMPPPGGEIRLTLPAGESRRVTAQQLESGGNGLSGSFGDGSGKWTLFVSTNQPIRVMNILQSSEGNLTNLSRTTYQSQENQEQDAFANGVTHGIPLVPPASHPLQQGFVRIVNRSNRDGTVTIHALDDTGGRFGPISFELRENTAVHFNSTDMEQGNTAKGLLGSTGSGNGNWRLELESDLDIEALAYIRTGSGFLTSMHDLVAEVAPGIYRVPIFNPGSNLGQQSRLRLTNAGSSDAEITITGRDDQGMPPPGGELRLTLPAGESRRVTAQQLESGGNGLSGSFGDGSGKWTLFVSTNQPIRVMNILQSSDENLTNLSSTPYVEHGSMTECGSTQAGLAPVNQEEFDCLVVGGHSIFRYRSDLIETLEVIYHYPYPRIFDSEQTFVTLYGNYIYENAGPNAGIVTFRYSEPELVAGETCTARLTFESETGGQLSGTCTSVYLVYGDGTFLIRRGPGR